jgi:molybdopterin synthase catalytic subunit
MFAVVREPIDVRAVENAVRAEGIGGVVTFIGTVRDASDDGTPVDSLSYEAHEAMAISEFETIANEACARHGARSIAVVHRIGDLTVGDVAVVVSASAVHRAQAFEACSYAIDALKSRAPIWKKEYYRDGCEARWRENVSETIA